MTQLEQDQLELLAKPSADLETVQVGKAALRELLAKPWGCPVCQEVSSFF
jgi:hypothetical protein